MLNKRTLPPDDRAANALKKVFQLLENQLADSPQVDAFVLPIAYGSLDTKFTPSCDSGCTLPIALDDSDFSQPL
jgi:hypothetical protein